MILTLADVWNALSQYPWPSAWPNPTLGSVVIDSRQAGPHSLFVAFRGEHVDGHTYVAHAFSRGADAALVERPPAGIAQALDTRLPPSASSIADMTSFSSSTEAPLRPGLSLCLLVDNTLRALQRVAAAWRTRFPGVRVVGVTGSVGKTTSKELIAAVLSQRYTTLKNIGNLNNEIGLPLTLLQLDSRHERVVLEMGMYDLGEIAQLCQIAKPHIGVVTNVGPVHLERLGAIERIAQAKAELVTALPADGVAVLNADDPLVDAMASQAQAQRAFGLSSQARIDARIFRYGLFADCDLWADEIMSEGLDGIRFRFHYRGRFAGQGESSVHVRVPLLGRHSVHTALRAASVGLVEGLSWEEIVSGLQDPTVQLRLVVAPGLNGATLIDDTYNASPASSLAALNLLADLDVNGGRRIAVLGDMLELGSYEEIGHRKVGARAAGVVHHLVTVGKRARWIADEAQSAGLPRARIEAVEDAQTAIAHLRLLIGPGDMVLVKGSRATGLDQIVMALTLPRSARSAADASQISFPKGA